MKKAALILNFVPVLAISLILIFAHSVGAITNSQLAVSSSGSQADIVSDEGFSATPDGKYIAFDSTANYIVSGDTNGKGDVFVRNTTTGTTQMASVSSSGTIGNNTSGYTGTPPVITNNGRYVLFYSIATNLITGGGSGIYMHDMKTGSTILVVSAATVNVALDAASEDGRFVYYSQTPSAGGSYWGAYVKDMLLGTTTQISTNASGTPANAGPNEYATTTSCDGRFATFFSTATNLVTGDTNGAQDVFLVDSMGTHTITDITLSGNDSSLNPVITCDGDYVLFWSLASNLVSGDTNGTYDAFLYSVANGTTERISLGAGGTQLSQGGFAHSISADGRFATFTSYATAPTYNDECYVYDRTTQTTKLISQNTSSQPADGACTNPVISADGRTVRYLTRGGNMGITNTTHLKYLYEATGF